jgi:hypothetical protein
MAYCCIWSGCYGLVISLSSNEIGLARNYACSVLQDPFADSTGYLRLVAFLVNCDRFRACKPQEPFVHETQLGKWHFRSSELRLES